MRFFAQRSIDSQFFGSTLADGGSRTEAGVSVTHDTALTDDAIFACVSLLATDIASLPMRAYVTDGELTRPLEHQPSWIEAPDPLDLAITDAAHKTQVALSLLLAGNAYILCEPNVFNPITLTVLNPLRVRVRKPDTERLFDIFARSSMFEDWSPKNVETLSSAQILHIPYLLRPGRLEGLSPIDAQRGNIGISLAVRKWVETFFGKGGQVGGFVTLPVDAPETALPLVESALKKRLSGWRNAGVLGVLSGGANFMKTGLTPQDADLSGLWRRQLEMAARDYGIPPFMVGSQEPAGVAYASSVDRTQFYLSHCVARYTRPMEKAYSRLVPGDGRLQVPHSNTEVRFVFDAFLRGDPAARWQMYLNALQSKARTIDEVRALENLPPMGEYTQAQLEGPGGLLQTPNNNPRAVPAGGTEPPVDEAAAPDEPTAPPTLTPIAGGLAK